MTTISIITYGCAMNQSDSERIAGILKGNSFDLSDDGEILIVNTCSVKTPTEKKIIKRLKELEISERKVIVSGCLPAANPDIADKFKNFSFIGNNIIDIVDAVKNISEGKRFIKLSGLKNKFCIPRIRQNPVVEIVPVAEGCRGSCSYCQTRLARGRLHSYPEDKIVGQIQNAVSSGVKEIWITAQDTGAYGIDTGENLPDLLERICEIPYDFKVRVGMMNPNHVLNFPDELISVYKNEKIYKFLHIPVQSGDNKILKDMNRKYTVDEFRKIVKEFRKNMDITISTDVIAGFPTETEEAFENTLNLIKEIKPDVLNISRFWSRPGTSAEKLKQHHGRVTKSRSRKMDDLFRVIGLERNREWIGWKGRAMVSEKTENGFCARNFAYKPIVINSKENLPGRSIDVKITDATYYDLRGEVV